MNFKEFIKVAKINEYVDTSIQSSINSIHSDIELFNTINPETGYKYDIPMLSTLDPDYFNKYVYYMKLKKSSPATFEQIINWE